MADRLDKFLSDNAGMTRSEAKKAITGGRVRVNDAICKETDRKVSDGDSVTADGKEVRKIGFVYIALNKPAGVISATEDSRDKTVLDLVYENAELEGKIPTKDLFPIGRLDKDTEGIIIITNDGMLSHMLLSPKKHVEKEYIAECSGKLADDAVQRFGEGIMVGEEYRALPAELKVLSKNDDSCSLDIILTEGRFHQVKRMCHEIGVEVEHLRRVRFGKYVLPDTMKLGDMRLIGKDEI